MNWPQKDRVTRAGRSEVPGKSRVFTMETFCPQCNPLCSFNTQSVLRLQPVRSQGNRSKRQSGARGEKSRTFDLAGERDQAHALTRSQGLGNRDIRVAHRSSARHTRPANHAGR